MSENRLDQESSPYLLQHADNPVHWRAWGLDTLEYARETGRPILLSVGYAACHWCHVMAHESFEDADTAALMNELFVNIKVDREERPDIDAIYQHALALLGRQGGWPLTMFLTPAGEPFWGGTYFPPAGRHGLPGFPDLLRTIAEFYHAQPDRLAEAVTGLKTALDEMSQSASGAETIPGGVADELARRLAGEFDKVNGGIGGAPKFPNPSIMKLIWRGYRRNGDAECRDAVLLTLDRMSQGGIYDHLGGGYARYSTDSAWLVPHFEKMLYDNAQIVDLLTAAWQETGKPLYAERVAETADWVLREMIAEGGGFAATLDADSEGEEGRYYVWSAGEIDRLLGADATLFAAAYDVRAAGNWEGRTILHRNHGAGPFGEAEEARLAACRTILLDERANRVRPGWDDKVLADWNGLMIAALANAAAVFERPEWREAAIRAFRFVTDTMIPGGRLRHNWRRGKLGSAATLDDYANMGRAALLLYETTGDDAYISLAEDWIAVLDAHYLDETSGGYFFTADDSEALIVRRKSADDNATPSGNGVTAEILAKLHYFTGKTEYRQRAEQTFAAFSGAIAENFFPLATLINASETLQSTTQIIVLGERAAADTQSLLHAAFTAPAPLRLLSVIPPAGTLPTNHPATGKHQVDGAATAYVCIGQTCSLPITDAAALSKALR